MGEETPAQGPAAYAVGEVRAIRTFRLGRDGGLFPLYTDRPWAPEANTARCRRRSHLAPAPGCRCGFYAYSDVLWTVAQPPSRSVLAVVALWVAVEVATPRGPGRGRSHRSVVAAPSGPAGRGPGGAGLRSAGRVPVPIRSYLRFSEDTVRAHGISPQQYQLMLALAGFPGREWATVKEVAERLQLKHHSVVELVNRAQQQELVARAADPDDARVVRVVLTTAGERALGLLSAVHRDELHRMGSALTPPPWPGEVSRS